MSKIERNKLSFFLELTYSNDPSRQIPKTEIEEAIWIEIDHSDLPEPLRMEHRSDGKFWTISLQLDPYIYNDDVSITYRYHFGSFHHQGDWKFTSENFKIKLEDLKRNNIEYIDCWDAQTFNLIPIEQKLANFHIICPKKLETSDDIHMLHTLYLLGPIEEYLLKDPAELDKYINDPDQRVRNANRMEAVPNKPNHWQTTKSIPIQKIYDFGCQNKNDSGIQLTFLIVKSYYHNRRLSYFRVTGKTNMQVSSQELHNIEGHVRAQMDIVLVVNDQADDPFGLDIVEPQVAVNKWMEINFEFDRLNHNLEEEPGEVYMVFEKYGKHKLDKINGKWYLSLKVLQSEWESTGDNLAYEFLFISKNKVKAYKPPVIEQKIEFSDKKPVLQQYLITTNNIITYQQVSKAPPPPPHWYIHETTYITNNTTTVNNNIDIQTRPIKQQQNTHISHQPDHNYTTFNNYTTYYNNYYVNTGFNGSSTAHCGNTQFGGSNIQSTTARSSQSNCYHGGASFSYTSYYSSPDIYSSNGIQQSNSGSHSYYNIAPQNQWIYYNHFYQTYQQQPEFEDVVQVVNYFLTNNTYRIVQLNYQDIRNKLSQYKSGKYAYEPEIGVYFMNQVKEIQKLSVQPLKSEMVFPLELCYKFMENNIKSVQVKDKFKALMEVKKLKPQNQSLESRQFQLMLLSKKWGTLLTNQPQQKLIEIQIKQLLDDLINKNSSDLEVKQILSYFLRYCLEKLMIKPLTVHSCYQSHISPILTAALSQFKQFDNKLEQHPLFSFYKKFCESDFKPLMDLAVKNGISMMQDPQNPKLEISMLKALMIFASIQSILNERFKTNLHISCADCSEFGPYCSETQRKLFFSSLQKLSQLEPYIKQNVQIITPQEIKEKIITAEKDLFEEVKKQTTEHQTLVDIIQLTIDKDLIQKALINDDIKELNFDVIIQEIEEIDSEYSARSLATHQNVQMIQTA